MLGTLIIARIGGGKPEWTAEAVRYLQEKGIELVIDREVNVHGLRLFGSPWVEK